MSGTSSSAGAGSAAGSGSGAPLGPRRARPVRDPMFVLPLRLGTVGPKYGATKAVKRVGRGVGSGRGKTAGRGHKGQNSRAGSSTRPGFEGGQTPMWKKLPRVGFQRRRLSRRLLPCSVTNLARAIAEGKLDTSRVITMREIHASGICGKVVRENSFPPTGVKLLSPLRPGSFKVPGVRIEVSACSARARKAIEDRGGTVTTVYYNRLGLRALVKPEKFVGMIKPAGMPPKLRLKGQYDRVGTLSQHVPETLREKLIRKGLRSPRHK